MVAWSSASVPCLLPPPPPSLNPVADPAICRVPRVCAHPRVAEPTTAAALLDIAHDASALLFSFCTLLVGDPFLFLFLLTSIAQFFFSGMLAQQQHLLLVAPGGLNQFAVLDPITAEGTVFFLVGVDDVAAVLGVAPDTAFIRAPRLVFRTFARLHMGTSTDDFDMTLGAHISGCRTPPLGRGPTVAVAAAGAAPSLFARRRPGGIFTSAVFRTTRIPVLPGRTVRTIYVINIQLPHTLPIRALLSRRCRTRRRSPRRSRSRGHMVPPLRT